MPKVDPLLRKQLEIIGEIVDSEKKYVDDLHAIESVFVIPLKVSLLVNSEAIDILFSNIHEIQSLHEDISLQLEHLPTVPNKSSVIETIRIFSTMVFSSHVRSLNSIAMKYIARTNTFKKISGRKKSPTLHL